MFRRKSESAAADQASTPKESGKGHATPTRKQAEAERMARVRTPRTRQEQAAAARNARGENSQKMREAMRTGDDRYLPARDKGPLRRFTRDYVDIRVTLAEMILPALLVIIILGWSGNSTAQSASSGFMMLMLLGVILNLLWLRWGLHRELKRRFPDASRRGITRYAVMRALQVRFLRMPKSQVRIGQKLPDNYR